MFIGFFIGFYFGGALVEATQTFFVDPTDKRGTIIAGLTWPYHTIRVIYLLIRAND